MLENNAIFERGAFVAAISDETGIEEDIIDGALSYPEGNEIAELTLPLNDADLLMENDIEDIELVVNRINQFVEERDIVRLFLTQDLDSITIL